MKPQLWQPRCQGHTFSGLLQGSRALPCEHLRPLPRRTVVVVRAQQARAPQRPQRPDGPSPPQQSQQPRRPPVQQQQGRKPGYQQGQQSSGSQQRSPQAEGQAGPPQRQQQQRRPPPSEAGPRGPPSRGPPRPPDRHQEGAARQQQPWRQTGAQDPQAAGPPRPRPPGQQGSRGPPPGQQGSRGPPTGQQGSRGPPSGQPGSRGPQRRPPFDPRQARGSFRRDLGFEQRPGPEEEDAADADEEEEVLAPAAKAEPAHGMYPGVKGMQANKEIQASDVRLLRQDKSMVGIVSMKEALQLATDEEADVILISGDSAPPVCRLIALDKYKYELAKVERETKRKQREARQDLKELKIRPGTDVHDYQVRLRSAQKFLSKGDRVKVTLQFKGREISLQDSANDMMQRFITDLGDAALVAQPPAMQGRALVMVLGPNKN